MQTFLPYEDYKETAIVLDRMRLGKQRVETLQLLQALTGNRLVSSTKTSTGKSVPLPKNNWTIVPVKSKGWRNHPAALMWDGFESELLNYQEAICNEWTGRGYKDTCLEKTRFLLEKSGVIDDNSKPDWLGLEKFHLAHRSNLLRKDPEHYRQYWPGVRDDLPYYWPSANE